MNNTTKKFSYWELPKRVSNLEKEVEDLKKIIEELKQQIN